MRNSAKYFANAMHTENQLQHFIAQKLCLKTLTSIDISSYKAPF